jgi:hypothetical protein
VTYLSRIAVQAAGTGWSKYLLDEEENISVTINGVDIRTGTIPNCETSIFKRAEKFNEDTNIDILWIYVYFTIPGELAPMTVNYNPDALHIPSAEVGTDFGMTMGPKRGLFEDDITVTGGSGNFQIKMLEDVATGGGNSTGGSPGWFRVLPKTADNHLGWELTATEKRPHPDIPTLLVDYYMYPYTPYAAQKLTLEVKDKITGEVEYPVIHVGAGTDSSNNLNFIFDWKYAVPSGPVNTKIDSINLMPGVHGGTAPYYFFYDTSFPQWLPLNPNTGVLSGTRPATEQAYELLNIRVTDNTGHGITINIPVGQVYDGSTGVPKGDIGFDGSIDLFDLLAVLDHINGTVPLSGDSLFAADVNGDGEVDLFDLLAILDHINGVKPLYE